MGAFAGQAKNEAIKKLGELAKFVGLLTASAESAEVAQVDTKTVKLTAHGLSAGNIIVFKSLAGGTGLVVGRPYFVIEEGLEAGQFRVAQKEAGTAETWTATLTGGKFVKLTEVSGGTYARVEIPSWSAPNKGAIEDTTSRAINVPAGTNIAFIGYWEKSTSTPLIAISELTAPEKLESAGTYTVTNSKLDAEAVA